MSTTKVKKFLLQSENHSRIVVIERRLIVSSCDTNDNTKGERGQDGRGQKF